MLFSSDPNNLDLDKTTVDTKRSPPPPRAVPSLTATHNQVVHDTLMNVLVHIPKPCDVGSEPTPSTLSLEQLRTFITRRHSTDINCTVCQDQLAFSDTCCQMLCNCKQACWIHSHCLATQINIGHHSNSNCLMRCGACRESLWGQQCEQNFHEVAVLLNRRFDVSNQLGSLHDAQRAYAVALDCARTLVRLGGGSIGNPLLGVALCSIASAMFEIDRHTNNRVDPERFRSGELCYFSIMTLSTTTLLKVSAPRTTHPRLRHPLPLEEAHVTI